MLEFAEHQDFAIDRIELGDGAADPQDRFRGVELGGIRLRVTLAEKRGTERSFAAMGTW